jgi:hypothetical protein
MKPAHQGGRFTAARRRLLSSFAVTVAILGGAMTAGLAASASTTVAPDTVTRIGQLPNAYGTGTGTSLLLDSANHLLFEYNSLNGSCPWFTSFDTTTLARVAIQPCDNTSGAEGVSSTNPGGGPLPPNAAVDPVDGVILGFTQTFSPPASAAGTSGSHVDVISESSLRRRGAFTLPTTVPESNIVGISWYAPLDEVIITSTYGAVFPGVVPSVPGIAVSAYSVPEVLKTTGTSLPAPLWSTATVGSCINGLQPSYFTAAAYHAGNEAAIYVPCQLLSATSATLGAQVDGVVKLTMGATPGAGTTCSATSKECLTGASATAAAPGWVADFYFDPVTDRGFMPLNLNGEATALVYDGRADKDNGAFIGKIDLGATISPGSSSLGAIIGLDNLTGRIYAVDAGGLTLVDTRRAQIAPGTTLSEYGQQVTSGSSVVLPPTAGTPYPRLVVSNFAHSGGVPYFYVYADAIAIGQDPKSTDVDLNTYSGMIPPGATVTKSSAGTARGYGVHFDYVGGPQGTVDNTGGQFTQFTGLPFGAGNRDLLGASVDYVTQQDGTQDGSASPLTDGNGTTSYDYRQCSDSATFGNCASIINANACPQQAFGGPCPPPPPMPGNPPDSNTKQDWLAQTATCSQPGSPSSAKAEVTGLQVNGDPQSTVNQQSTNDSKAQVDCSGAATENANGESVSGGTTASSVLRSFASGASYQPNDNTINFASADTIAHVLPATDKSPAESVVEATVRGLQIDLGSDGTISIGEISHREIAYANGAAGSASTVNTVTIADVDVEGANGTVFACTTTCNPSQVMDAINTNFPYVLHAITPTADAPFGFASDGTSPKGSPGGYTSAVVSNQAEQFGDKQYNGMSKEEATMLPAFRLVLYAENDGTPNLSRLVMDFAGGQVDTETGLQVLDGFGGDASGLPSVPIADAAAAAGVPSLPIDNGNVGGSSIPTPTPIGTSGPTGSLGLVMRSLSGLAWLARSPGAAMQMAAFLILLGLPIALMRRRWTWSVKDLEGES